LIALNEWQVERKNKRNPENYQKAKEQLSNGESAPRIGDKKK
jgi:hypothetical protein